MSCRQHLVAAALATLFGLAPAAAWAQSTGLVRAPEVEEAYNRGRQLLDEEKYREAVAAFNEAINLDPTYAEPFIAKGDALQELEDYQGAGASYTRAIEIDANSGPAYNGRGECFMNATPPDYNLALNDFRNALELDRSNAEALSNMGHVLIASGQDPTAALRFLDDALLLDPSDARALRDRGTAHAQLREFDEAVADLQKATEVDPEDHENFATLATIYSYQDDFAGAADAWSKAIATYKPKKYGEPKTYVTGYIFRADARLKVAETETDEAKRTAALEGAVADANAVLAEYEDRFPESGRALYRRGRAERMLEQYSTAIDSFTKAIQNAQSGQDIEYISDAYLYRGICFYYIGSMELARGDFEQASATGSGFSDPRIYLWIGITHHREGDYRQAIDAYNQAIAKSPNFALAYINRGRAYMDLKEYKKAIESFSSAIRSEPDVGDHYYNVGYACLKLEEYQKAVDFLNLALHKENPQPKMYRAMAAALRGLGRNELAEKYEQQAGAAPETGAGG